MANSVRTAEKSIQRPVISQVGVQPAATAIAIGGWLKQAISDLFRNRTTIR